MLQSFREQITSKNFNKSNNLHKPSQSQHIYGLLCPSRLDCGEIEHAWSIITSPKRGICAVSVWQKAIHNGLTYKDMQLAELKQAKLFLKVRLQARANKDLRNEALTI